MNLHAGPAAAATKVIQIPKTKATGRIYPCDEHQLDVGGKGARTKSKRILNLFRFVASAMIAGEERWDS
jgi:hypothetical protein